MLSRSKPGVRSGSTTRFAPRLLAAALLAIALVCAACTSDPEAPATTATVPMDWGTITDDETGLSFRVPGDVERLNQPVQLPDGSTTELRVYSFTDGDREMTVSMLPLDPSDFDLTAAAGGAAEAVNGELVQVTPIDTLGFRGRHIEIAARRDGRGWSILQRIFLTDDSLVQLSVAGPEADRADLVEQHEQLVAGVE